MTEEEAKTKWCPQSGTDVGHPHGLCIAGGCAAFQFLPQTYEHLTMGRSYVDRATTNGAGTKGVPLPRQGYCGLAGEPE